MQAPLTPKREARAKEVLQAWRDLLDLLDRLDMEIDQNDPDAASHEAWLRGRRETINVIALRSLGGPSVVDSRRPPPLLADVNRARAEMLLTDALDSITRLVKGEPFDVTTAMRVEFDPDHLGRTVRQAIQARAAIDGRPSRTMPDAAELTKQIHAAVRKPPEAGPDRFGSAVEIAARILAQFVPLSGKHIEDLVRRYRRRPDP